MSLQADGIWVLVKLIEKGLLNDWDFVLRRMFVQKATPVARTIPFVYLFSSLKLVSLPSSRQLAPGAAGLLKKVTARGLDIKTEGRRLNAHEWKIIAEVFADWPFKPEVHILSPTHPSSSD